MLLASIGCACCSGSASFGRRSGQDEIQLRGSDADGNEPKKRRNCRLVTQSRRQLVSARLTSALSGFLKKPCRSPCSLIVVFIGCQTTDSSERGIFPDWELRLREMNLLRLICVEISSPSLLISFPGTKVRSVCVVVFSLVLTWRFCRSLVVLHRLSFPPPSPA